MVRCDRCDGYVSRNYARVFGDNQDCIASCPNCRAGWRNKEESSAHEETDQGLTFRMSEFEAADRTAKDDGSTVPETTGDSDGNRFGRVGRAVSGLF